MGYGVDAEGEINGFANSQSKFTRGWAKYPKRIMGLRIPIWKGSDTPNHVRRDEHTNCVAQLHNCVP